MTKITDESTKNEISAKSRQNIEERRREIYRSMSAEKKLSIAADLYFSALSLKKSHLRRKNPNWSEKEVEKKAREWMLYART